MRAHHFKLWFSPNSFETIVNQSFKPYPVEKVEKQESNQLKDKIKSSSIIFGDEPIQSVTTNHSDYTKKETNKISIDEINEAKLKLQRHHFKLGTDKQIYETTNMSSFPHGQNLSPPIKAVNLNLLQSKIQFDDQTSHIDRFISEARRSFADPGIVKQSKERTLDKFLKDSHFKLGNYQGEFKSESMINYTEKEIPRSQLINKNRLKKTNFIIGDFPPTYETENNRIPKFDEKNYHIILASNNEINRENYVLWNDKIDYISEAKSRYTEKPLEKVDKDQINKQISIIRDHHFNLRDMAEGGRCLPTPKKETPGNTKSPKKNINTVQYLKQTHFQLGSRKNDYITTNQATYPIAITDRSSYIKKENELRNHHFNLGDGERDFKTIHRESYTWLQPHETSQ